MARSKTRRAKVRLTTSNLAKPDIVSGEFPIDTLSSHVLKLVLNFRSERATATTVF